MDESGRLDPSADSNLRQILSDYSRRVAAGEAITQADLISQNPAVAEALRAHFQIARSIYANATDSSELDSGTSYVRLSTQTTIPPATSGTALSSMAAASLPEQFGRYRIVRSLGQGAMGAVYLAQDSQLDRPVALKIPKFTQASDAELIERFYREARAAATLRHPNLCPVYDAGQIEGVHYLSMAFLDGQLLADALAGKGPPSVRDAVTIVLKLAKALDAAHSAGVVHRDLKPANIMLDVHQEPILMDFGLARRTNKEDSRLTQSGLVMGSPAYMSPEQVEGDADKMGASCDIYGLGVIFYELLTGQVPFKGSIAAVMGQIVTAAPKRPSLVKPGIDPALEAICLKMIAKRPEDRFRSMREVAAALEAYSAGRPTGVVVSHADMAPARPLSTPTDGHATRGIVIAPWMLWTAIVVVVAGFGVTWQLIATMMKQQIAAESIKLDASTSQALAKGEAKVFLNDKPLTAEQLKGPVEVPAGTNKVEVREGDTVKGTSDVVSDKDDPTILEMKNKTITFTRRHRWVANWVIASGGNVKTDASDAMAASVDALPAAKFLVREIDLTGVESVPPDRLRSIEKLGDSLKILILPRSGLTPAQVDALRKSLPNCEIKAAAT